MKAPFRSFLIGLGVLALVVAASVGIYGRIRAAQSPGDDDEGGSSGPRPHTSATSRFSTDVAIPVKGVAAVRDTLVVAVNAAGQAEGWKKTVVVAQVAGRVASLPVRENDAVGGGQLLTGIDAAEYGLAVVVRLLASGGRIDVPSACAIVALLLAGAIAAPAIRSRAVLRTVETGTLADAPDIARYLLERLRIGDRIVVRNPSDHVLDYYLWRSGGRRLREINARPATNRVFVVVEPRHLQTLESVQSIEPHLPWAELAASIPVDTFASARVYTFRSTAVNPEVRLKQPGQKQ